MTKPEETRAAVLGAGSWGTALALLLHEKGVPVRLWSFEGEVVEEVRRTGVNPYLEGVPIPDSLHLTDQLPQALEGADLVLSVSPAQHVDTVIRKAAPAISPHATVVSASKGIEIASLSRMDEVLARHLSPEHMERFCVLSGPSFAAEVVRGEPTAVVVAGRSLEARTRVQSWFSTSRFRVYTNPDVIGVELGGALKNVVALAAGVVSGLGFGYNTQAALITRGLAEITRLGVTLGAEARTFSGLAGMGDLVLTCTGELSRNRTVGNRLGQGETLNAILSDMRAVAEGVRTTPAVHALAARHGVEMPIVAEVHAILEGERSPAAAVERLMLRDPKPEAWS
jgi:glycerol-3-phosphate dehydrogenase (NAD(P)+)